jgi:malate/lactate dehydrogenase
VLSSCGGVEQVVHLELDQEEIEKLRLSAAVLKQTIKSLELG